MSKDNVPQTSKQITYQELAERFKRLEKSFIELKAEVKVKLKELQQG